MNFTEPAQVVCKGAPSTDASYPERNASDLPIELRGKINDLTQYEREMLRSRPEDKVIPFIDPTPPKYSDLSERIDQIDSEQKSQHDDLLMLIKNIKELEIKLARIDEFIDRYGVDPTKKYGPSIECKLGAK